MKKRTLTLLSLFLLCACNKPNESNKNNETNSNTNTPTISYTFENEDFYTEYSDAITLESNTITQAGTYELTGTYSHGIEVDVNNNETVRLILNNASINGKVKIKQAKKVTISLFDGTINTVTSEEDGINSDVPLVFNGTGVLKVESSSKDGIQCTQDLIITDGTYEVNSLDNGIDSDRLIAINNGNFTINTTEGDGIKVGSATDEGLLFIENGNYTINGHRDGISCDGNLGIQNGNYAITTTEINEEESQKGLKASKYLEINNGKFTFDTIDDSMHSNGGFTISNIDATITTVEKGLHADGTLLVKNGTIKILSCDEGLEAKILQIDGGTIDIISSDDGFNADDKASDIEMGAQEGVDIIINGGTITIQAGGDGIDSNNTLHINGGKTYVYSNGQADSALDYESEMILTGGEFIACGPAGMATTPSNTSTQPFVTTMAYSQGKVKLTDANNNTLLEWEVPGNYNHVIISHPNLVQDESYTLYCGEISQTITATTQGTRQQMFPGGGMVGQRPGGFNQGQKPEGFDESQLPDDFDPSQMPEKGQRPDNFDPNQLPEDFNPSQIPGGGRFPQQDGNMIPPNQQESDNIHFN